MQVVVIVWAPQSCSTVQSPDDALTNQIILSNIKSSKANTFHTVCIPAEHSVQLRPGPGPGTDVHRIASFEWSEVQHISVASPLFDCVFWHGLVAAPNSAELEQTRRLKFEST